MPSYPTAGPSPAQGIPTMEEVGPKDQQLMVALRIRPLSDTELEEGATVIAHRVGGQTVVLMDPSEDPEDTLRTHRSREKTFTFDTVFDQHASQEDVYRATTQQLVAGVISGYNATVFAYGPSGTGKTYTMLGMDTEPGIYLQTLTDLFRAIEDTRDHMDCRVSMSYLEIYNEVIRDLLNPSSGLLDLREDARGGIQIAGVTEVCTSNAQEIMQLLSRGNRQRTQEPTASNRASSRSHAVLQVTVLQQSRGADSAEGVRVGRLFMVDLAGSERASQTQNRGKRMQEGAHINRSLLALGNCINALSEKGGSRSHYVNFRDSKLTRLLKDALGGNSWTVMIAHISPASSSFEESRTTLLYADRAKNIKTRVKRNLLNVSCHMDQYTDVIADLRGQIEHLRSRIDRQDRTGSEPGLRDAPVTMPAAGTEEDSHLRMDRLRAQLVGTFQEQQEAGRGLVALEHTSVELHVDMSRLLLAIAHRDQTADQFCSIFTSTPVSRPAGAHRDSQPGLASTLTPAPVTAAAGSRRPTTAARTGRPRGTRGRRWPTQTGTRASPQSHVSWPWPERRSTCCWPSSGKRRPSRRWRPGARGAGRAPQSVFPGAGRGLAGPPVAAALRDSQLPAGRLCCEHTSAAGGAQRRPAGRQEGPPVGCPVGAASSAAGDGQVSGAPTTPELWEFPRRTHRAHGRLCTWGFRFAVKHNEGWGGLDGRPAGAAPRSGLSTPTKPGLPQPLRQFIQGGHRADTADHITGHVTGLLEEGLARTSAPHPLVFGVTSPHPDSTWLPPGVSSLA
ncbi:kinesin-like protein KIF19 isoform 5-T6 [Molossus nigricans]